MRNRDKARDAKRNRQMPEQTRIQRILHLKQRADKNGYAQEPGEATNRRCEPGQMNQAPPRFRDQFTGGDAALSRKCSGVGAARRPYLRKPMKQVSKRKDSFQPQINPDGINNGVVNHDRSEEAVS